MAHAADRGDAETDHVPASRSDAEQRIVGSNAAKLGARQRESSSYVPELIGGNVVLPGPILRLVEDRQETVAWFHLGRVYPPRSAVKQIGETVILLA